MPNVRGKSIDKTFLSVDNAEERGFIHRDYLAHCLRWTHVCKYLAQQQRYKEALVLDVGCGRELPLAKTLYSSRYIPRRYVGVDYGPINADAIATLTKTDKFPGTYMPDTDITTADLQPKEFNLITCFEVFEHVEPEHGVRMLRTMLRLLTDDGRLMLSTPCYNERSGAADNHVNETSYEALGSILETVGFRIEANFGTFASIRDYEQDAIEDRLGNVFDKLREYYDTNYLATIFAPLYPHRSRNVLWVLRKAVSFDEPRNFKVLEQIQKPWSQSANQDDFLIALTKNKE
jgi:SAM-dependent methyltransferase